jgi:hypothetical protein
MARPARRLELPELLLLAAPALALVGYVYVIGWVITCVRLAAVGLPIGFSLPALDDAAVLATGARSVLVMAIVFAGMCIFAYLIHLGRWDRHADEWRLIVTTSRTQARERRQGLKRGPPRRARRLRRGDSQEAVVRLVAGFNVGVLAAALGLVGGRLGKTVIDQWQPGHWWALLAPWALCTVLIARALLLVSPLRGGRLAHALLWTGVIVVAMLSSAPIGLLVLTWAGIGTLGRRFGANTLPGSSSAFLRSPLPWALLTVYALVALSYAAMPPVGFSQTVVQTASGRVLGGYVGRSGSDVYLATCTPLADATSVDDRVQAVPAAIGASLTSTGVDYTLDTGYRPSLPTLALHALGIDTQTVAWIRPELKERRAPCAGTPPPRPGASGEAPQPGMGTGAPQPGMGTEALQPGMGTEAPRLGAGTGALQPGMGTEAPRLGMGTEAPQLGAGVFAVRAMPREPRDAEPSLEGETRRIPRIAALAKRFQPTLLTSITDPFWPVSLEAVLEDIGSDGRHPCVRHGSRGKRCAPGAHATLGELSQSQGAADDYLEYPVKPALTHNPTPQLDAFLRGLQGREHPVPSQRALLADPGALDPWASAQIYFYYAGVAGRMRWPVREPYSPREAQGLVALEYWFFYPYNYFPTLVQGNLMEDAPIAADVANTDLHQGDWEHVVVFVERTSGRARWLYTARHANEGRFIPWDDPSLAREGEHPVVQAAYGGHPTYPAGCGERQRFIQPLNGLVADWLVCGPGRFAFRASTTPLVDLAARRWACWRGHFGAPSPGLVQRAAQSTNAIARTLGRELKRYVLVAGPRSPLWQAENGNLEADEGEHEHKPDSGPCVAAGGPQEAEREAEGVRADRPTKPPRTDRASLKSH